MIFNKVFDEIFSSGSQIAVLRSLKNSKTGITGHEVARLSGLSPKAALTTLSKLESLKIVKRVIGGRDHYFTLNRTNYLVETGIIPLLSIESSFLNALLSKVSKETKNYCLSIVLFGSVARKEEVLESDIDLCFIVEDVENGRALKSKISDMREIIYETFGVYISPNIFTKSKLIESRNNNSSLINSIINEGILVKGKPLNQILNDAKNK